jgi:hypothetical protein
MNKIIDIFNETLIALNLTIIDDQKIPIFNLINRKFFSNVQPIVKYDDFDYFTEHILKDNNIFEVIDYEERDNETIAKIKPLDYNEFELDYSYLDAYQTVCEMILERFESYNMQTLRGLGVNDIDTKIDISYQEVDEYLFKKFNVVGADLWVS